MVYVSLGSNVRPSMMDRELLDAFLNAFAALPYDILWKFDGEHLPKLSNNVKVQKWFPQRDLLGMYTCYILLFHMHNIFQR